MFKTCYGVCFTPRTYHAYINWWKPLFDKDNSYLIVDNTENTVLDYDCFSYNDKMIRESFKFSGDVSQNHYWNSQRNRNIIWFYAHFRMLYFFLKNSEYDYYWFFDDDVFCNNWEGFLKGFENEDSDFLSYFLFKNTNVEIYPNIPKVDNRMFSGELWFRRFPGDGDKLFNGVNYYFGSFFPIVRYSRKALIHLLELTYSGYHGYGEGFVPTMLANEGFKMNTIFNPDNTSNFFNTDIIQIKHKNIKINWEWL
jgi:hypothetical protein